MSNTNQTESRTAQDEGIWAWDCETSEPVLVIPFVLAMLGDNPMQSEFACHIGLRGKFFCRACWVKGKDASDDLPAPPPAPDGGTDPFAFHVNTALEDFDSD